LWKNLKKDKKSFKKVLTREKKNDIIARLTQRKRSEKILEN